MIRREEIIGDCRLLLGDCLDVLPTLADGSVDMVLADLPYGTTQNKWDSIIPLDVLWREYWRVCRGPIVLTATQPFTTAIIASAAADFKYTWVWRKSRPTGQLNAKKAPLRDNEDVCVFYRQQPTYNPQFSTGRPNHVSGKPVTKTRSTNWGAQYEIVEAKTEVKYPRTTLDFPSLDPAKQQHPTQKPVPLIEYLVQTYTHAGDTVLDNTMGSGTAGVACVNTKRKFVGIEKDEAYFDIAAQRVSAARPDLFAEVA